MGVRLAEIVVDARELVALVVRPLLVRSLAHRLEQRVVAALFRELEEVDLAVFVELDILEIDVDVLSRVLGHDADDMGGNRDRVEEFEHADALVALLHIVAVHVFVRLDRLADALVEMRLAQPLPLVGELGFLVEDRHEVGGKRRHSALCLGADDEFRGHLKHAEVYALGDRG